MRQRALHSLTLPFTVWLFLLLAFCCCSTPVAASSSRVIKFVRGSSAAKAAYEKLSSSRIFGGTNATDGDAPHQVALFENGQFICGGSLIALRTVLTAAHCVYEYENTPSRFIVRYGNLKLNSTENKEVTVDSIDRHPLYSPLLTDYDVALLHLSADITTGTNAAIIQLAGETPPSNSTVIITGFGLKNYDEPLAPAEHLQVAKEMVVMDHEQCEHDWSNAGIPITDRILCIISDTQTALPGDSGGPMVYNGRLVGVTSFLMINIDELTIMDGYMNVATVKKWIESNMKNGAAAGQLVGQSTTLLAFILLAVGRLVQRLW